MPPRPTKIGARDPETGKWWTLWTDGKYRLAEADESAPDEYIFTDDSVMTPTGIMSPGLDRDRPWRKFG